jgi:predicted lipoprotein with Yx(FWY)xxD motif
MWNKMPTLIWLAGAAFAVGALAAPPDEAPADQAGAAVTVPSAKPTQRAPAPGDDATTPPGDDATPGDDASPDDDASPPATVLRLGDTALGEVVVDGKGRTLYLSSADDNSPPTTTCYGRCAKLWVPLRVRGKVIAEGVNSRLVGVLPREDGILQATYGGWPLYWFTKDKAPGETTGQGYRNSWSAIGVDGKRAGR